MEKIIFLQGGTKVNIKKEQLIKKCPHCEFIEKLYSNIESDKEYWQMTEVFVYLHNGKDYCNFFKKDK